MKKTSYFVLFITVTLLLSASLSFADCSFYHGKGYCTDYIKNKIGKKPGGDASSWPNNIGDKSNVKKGDAALFSNHVAYVEKVNTKKACDKKGKNCKEIADSVNISEWNYSKNNLTPSACEKKFGKGHTNCIDCIVTDKFGEKTYRNSVSLNSVKGFWRNK